MSQSRGHCVSLRLCPTQLPITWEGWPDPRPVFVQTESAVSVADAIIFFDVLANRQVRLLHPDGFMAVKMMHKCVSVCVCKPL